MKNSIEHVRHSLAHLLGAAVLDLYPGSKLAIGPAIEDGFYYDIDVKGKLSDTDLPVIEDKMRELLKAWKSFEGKEVSADEARAMFNGNQFKEELIADLEKAGEKITLYTSGSFTDLCRGGHVEDPSTIQGNSFKLSRLAGAYWRGSEKNPQLTRIYGLAFESKDKLKEYLTQREEAEKRDHKKLGKELGLFAFSPLVGPGLPLFLPKGETVFNELGNFMRQEKENLGYKFVHIPHIASTELYKKSGHLGKYDAMMPIMTDQDGDQFVMKAMNCPHHFAIYNSEPHSYRDLPYRIAENTTVYRNEKSGELSGLVRVKALTQDDTHHFVRHDQIQSEIEMILGLLDKVYKTFMFTDYSVQISIRDPKTPEKYFGDDSLWSKSEEILIESVKKWGRPYVVEEGEAAFYGPKIDIMVKDSIGRKWQLTTVQLDFNQPENFNMRYVGEDGQEHAPAVLHVAILGSIERFMGVLIEHYAGAFPLWLAPVQVAVINISDNQKAFAESVVHKLKHAGIRAELHDQNETLGKKIRNAEMQKIPYLFVIGDKELEAQSVAVRKRKDGDKGVMAIDIALALLKEEIDLKK
ncbi:MAG: threonine--tRNA ligase [Candidatus Pacebacteria bacterium]|nr:threonine--tRNA ligase [Candidatus Paceibacterota bacterium]